MSGQLHVDVEGAICTLTIDNAGKRNALGPDVVEAITAEFELLDERDDVLPVVITGAGEKAFCSGYDIDALGGSSLERGDRLAAMVAAIRAYEFPTIARINGDVIGAGVLLAIASDLRVATTDARFGIPAAKLGVVYEPVGIELLINSIGIPATTEILLTGELFAMDRATEMGFVHRLADGEALDDEVDELAARIASNAPLSMIGAKNALRAMLDRRAFTPGETRWIDQLRERAAASEDHEKARRAFGEDRSPEFEGR